MASFKPVTMTSWFRQVIYKAITQYVMYEEGENRRVQPKILLSMILILMRLRCEARRHRCCHLSFVCNKLMLARIMMSFDVRMYLRMTKTVLTHWLGSLGQNLVTCHFIFTAFLDRKFLSTRLLLHQSRFPFNVIWILQKLVWINVGGGIQRCMTGYC